MKLRVWFWAPISSLLVVALAACSADFAPVPSAADANHVAPVSGRVYGGQQPVTGGHVYLYATGTGGLGSASRSVLTSAVLTSSPGYSGEDGSGNYYVVSDSNGLFSLTGDYTCSLGESLYLYVTGGNSGSGTGSNAHIGLLAGLGTCASSTGDLSATVPLIQVNEISTIVTAYALAGFAAGPTAIGSGSTTLATTGMANAMANIPNVYNDATGLPLTTTAQSTSGSAGTVPANKILWLADILAACVNTDPTDAAGTCAKLFAAAPGPTGAAPADTAQVALNLAHLLSASTATITTLSNLITPQSPFGYTATTYTDLALPVVYATTVVGPYMMAFDQNGYLWLPDAGSTTAPLRLISPQGAVKTLSGFNYVTSFGINPGNNTIALSLGYGTPIDVYTTDDSSLTLSSPRYDVFQDRPQGPLFFDAANIVYAATTLNGGGRTPYTVEGYTLHESTLSSLVLSASFPSVTMDSNGNLWGNFVNLANGTYTQTNVWSYPNLFEGQPTSVPSLGYTGTLLAGGGGYVWYSDATGANLLSRNLSGAGVSCTGGGLTYGIPLATDGAGNLWAANYTYSTTVYQTVSAFNLQNGGTCSPLTSASGISNGVSPSLDSSGTLMAFDGSGNLWSLSLSNTVYNQFNLTQFLGIGVPAVTPMTPMLTGTSPQ